MALAFESFAPSTFRRFATFGGGRERTPMLPPEQEVSILRDLGGSALHGISAIGAGLDVPGGVVRNLLAGEDPTAPLRNPLSMQDRVWGRDLLEKSLPGIVPENYEGFSLNDPKAWADLPWDVAGFATEVLLDPLTYLTFGASALTKAGKAARGVGAMDDLAKVLASTKGVKATKNASFAGPRMTRLTGRLRQLTEATDPRFAKWKTELPDLAKKLGMSEGELLDAPLGTLGKFMGVGFGGGENRASLATAAMMDKLGHGVRYSAPVRYAAAHINQPMRGMVSRKGQEELATAVAGMGEESVAAARASVYPEVSEMVDMQWFDPVGRASKVGADPAEVVEQSHEFGNQFIRYMETGEDFNPSDFTAYAPEDIAKAKSIASSLAPKLKTMREAENAVGGATEELDDVVQGILTGYFPRVSQPLPGAKYYQKAGEHVIDVSKKHVRERTPGLTGFPGGTYALQRISTDDAISGIAAAGWSKDAKKQAITYLKNTYGDMLGEGAKYGAIAEWAAHLNPGHAANNIPAFSTNPINAIVARMEAGAEVTSALDAMHGFIADNLVEAGGVPIWEVFNKLPGVQPHRARFAFTQKLTGLSADELKAMGDDLLPFVKEIGEKRVSNEVADDLLRFVKSYTTPEHTSDVLDIYDKMLRAWKGSVTVLWPSFHSRNRISGALRNIQAGAWSKWSDNYADAILNGKVVNGAAEKFKSLKPDGMAAAKWTDEVATDAIRQELFANKVLTHHMGIGQEFMGSLGRHSEVIGPTQPEKVAGPGAVSALRGAFSPRPNPAAGFWRRANPIGDEGALQRYGSGIAYYVEGMNRISPYLKKRAEGWSGKEASRLVDMLQVNYEKLTSTEKTVLRRIWPFYTFQKGVIPWTVRTLLEKPGGVLAQTAKLPARAGAGVPVAPEYISETAAIPLDVNQRGVGKYLGTLGLMEEPGYSLMAPLLRVPTQPMSALGDIGREVIGHMAPPAKAGYEFASGRSAFFGGADAGGRPLQSMSPPIGQIKANITGERPTPLGTGFESEIGRAIEYGFGASPLSRAISSGVMLTKPSDMMSPGEKFLNFMTGMRTRNVSEAQANTLAREVIDRYTKSLGGREFTRTYVPDDMRAMLSTDSRQNLERSDMVLSTLRKRAKLARAAQ